jgi:hypothetical protein
MYSSFRYNFHGSVCLLSKFFQHFLEGENLYELDLNNYNDIDGNSFDYSTSLSSNWKGTCDLLEKITYFKNNYTNDLSILNTTLEISSCSSDTLCHKNTLNYFQTTSNLIDQLSTIKSISSQRPSGSIGQLTPNFELEFQNMSDLNTLGGIIYDNYVDNLMINMFSLGIIHFYSTEYIYNYGLNNELNEEYKNLMNFDKTVATAASIIMTNFINDKKLILNFFQFMFIFIFTGYLGTLVCIIIFLIVYQVEKYHHLYYFLIGFINLCVIFSLWAIVLGALFQGIRLFVRESPRVMQFLFTDDYILNGNTDAYPAKFGYNDQTQIDLFSTCLNGNGDLLSNYLNKNKLNNILTQTKYILDMAYELYLDINTQIQNSNLIKNSYNVISNSSYLYSSITKLEEIKNNLYLASDGFDADDIREIINTIRTNLDSASCQMSFEYYVIKKSDCPKYSILLTEITNAVEYIYHCYVIQDLVSGTRAQYTGTSCGNEYINNAIIFIKEISDILNTRINNLKELQTNYVLTYNNMYAEISQINSTFTRIADLLNNEINNNYPTANCSSIKFDLIDFCEFMYDKIGYKLKIMIIFSCLSGMLGYVALYAVLLILNKINENVYYSNEKNYLLNYQGYNSIYKERNIKPIYSSKNKTDDERFNYKYKNTLLDNEIKNKKIKRKLTKDENRINNNSNIRGNVVYNNIRKVEMKTFNNNNE